MPSADAYRCLALALAAAAAAAAAAAVAVAVAEGDGDNQWCSFRSVGGVLLPCLCVCVLYLEVAVLAVRDADVCLSLLAPPPAGLYAEVPPSSQPDR